MSSLSPFPPSRLKVGSPSTSSVFSSRAGHKGGGKRERVAHTDCSFGRSKKRHNTAINTMLMQERNTTKLTSRSSIFVRVRKKGNERLELCAGNHPSASVSGPLLSDFSPLDPV